MLAGEESSEATDAPFHIVLVEPQIPPNTGNVARLCAATGCRLHLVEPLGFSIGDRELKRAGLDYWDAVDVVTHRSLEAFLETWRAPLWLHTTRAQQTYRAMRYARGDGLAFGSESAGLPRSLLAAMPERTVRIPMRTNCVRSLNLSTCVGIATYAALADIGFPGLA
ncbi:MAG: tRNA (cytidine(34)-2'-O)-methyltransferase [Candidatus Eremiobacteraeota bacterium]|nr:tRNA (cytidine(34)-2'-O)-methyltransferase [Candidatus Eremiobacteraeota bacterium]